MRWLGIALMVAALAGCRLDWQASVASDDAGELPARNDAGVPAATRDAEPEPGWLGEAEADDQHDGGGRDVPRPEASPDAAAAPPACIVGKATLGRCVLR